MDNDLIDMIAANDSQADVHDKIKEILYAKSQENINAVTPAVTADMFGGPNPYLNDEGEVCLLYTSPSPRDKRQSRMPSSA